MIFAAIFILLIFFYLYFLFSIGRGLDKLTIKTREADKESCIYNVSVIIPFRDEEDVLRDNLRSLKKAEYPAEKLQVIYVDDNSADDSVKILEEEKLPGHFQIVSSYSDNESRGHKKRAILKGLESAKGDIIVISDADCIYQRDWLKSLLKYFDDSVDFVSGPVVFNSDGNIFQEIQKLEFASLVISGAGLIGAGTPVICNAANLAYRKHAFDRVGGYEGTWKLSSGDDEQLMHKIAAEDPRKVKFALCPDAVVTTRPNKSVRDLFSQRKRWASKGLYYPEKMIVIKLVLLFQFFISTTVSFFLALYTVDLFYILLFAAGMSMKFIADFIVLKKGSRLLFKDFSPRYYFITQLLHIPYIVFSAIAGLFGNYSWKGRRVKR